MHVDLNISPKKSSALYSWRGYIFIVPGLIKLIKLLVDFFIFSRVTECMHRSRDTKTYKLIWPKTFLKALVRFHVSADCWQLLKLSSHMSQIFPVCFLQLSLRSPCVWELSSTLLILLLSRRKSLGMTHCGGFHFRWVDKGCLCFFVFLKLKFAKEGKKRDGSCAGALFCFFGLDLCCETSRLSKHASFWNIIHVPS